MRVTADELEALCRGMDGEGAVPSRIAEAAKALQTAEAGRYKSVATDATDFALALTLRSPTRTDAANDLAFVIKQLYVFHQNLKG